MNSARDELALAWVDDGPAREDELMPRSNSASYRESPYTRSSCSRCRPLPCGPFEWPFDVAGTLPMGGDDAGGIEACERGGYEGWLCWFWCELNAAAAECRCCGGRCAEEDEGNGAVAAVVVGLAGPLLSSESRDGEDDIGRSDATDDDGGRGLPPPPPPPVCPPKPALPRAGPPCVAASLACFLSCCTQRSATSAAGWAPLGAWVWLEWCAVVCDAIPSGRHGGAELTGDSCWAGAENTWRARWA